jgi:hypothetical protein
MHIMLCGFQSLQNSADWFFLVPDRTFINVFQLNRLIQSLQWNSPVALGWAHPEDGGRCLLEAGILLSAPAMQLLVQGRHLCRDLGTAAQTEVLYFGSIDNNAIVLFRSRPWRLAFDWRPI